MTNDQAPMTNGLSMTGHKKFDFDASVVVAITFGGALILAFALAMIGAIFGSKVRPSCGSESLS
jgi:hypothetical protein